ncbi:MAG: hypothetical protein JNK74_21175 [Candidatus Hydrogenedentes bacterium]|nr:hypothetical protein [Candidatus Hydrogenedentota bacterium]
MSYSRTSLIVLASLLLLALLLAALPGTADVNVWKMWVDNLNRLGFVQGFTTGEGHILQPPLGMLLLVLAHNASAWIGLPDHVWPAWGLTSFDLSLWLALVASALAVRHVTRSPWLAVAFVAAFLLNGVVYGYFDIYCVPFWLLGMHASTEEKPGRAAFLLLIAVLIKWQFLVFVPFVGLHFLRGLFQSPMEIRAIARRAMPYLPAVLLLAVVLLLLGRGSMLSLARGAAHDTLSGYAMNLGWLLTWAMHVVWPDSYGPLQNGYIDVIRTQDTRVLGLLKVLFYSTFALALWRQWRAPSTPENLWRFMLAGYLSYFLFNKGAHENHLVPTMLVAGYLAWRERKWLSVAVAFAVLTNLNMYFFYGLDGVDRGNARVVWGMDWSLPLAVVYVVVVGQIYLKLLGPWPGFQGRRRRH